VHDLSFGTAKRRLARATARLNRLMQRDEALAAYLDLPAASGAVPAGGRRQLGARPSAPGSSLDPEDLS
jgi:hypothetical protein